MFVGRDRFVLSYYNLWLCREKKGPRAGQLSWDRETAKCWERWEIQAVDSKTYAFKSYRDSCYISAYKDGTVSANRKQRGESECFTIEELYPGSYVIKSALTGNILRPQEKTRPTCDSQEFDETAVVRIHPFFQFEGIMRSLYCGAHKKWVCSEPSLNLVCNRPKPRQWETFTIEKHDGKYAFKTWHGRYVTLPPGSEVLKADAVKVGPNELFTAVTREIKSGTEAIVVLYAPNGKLVTPMSDGKTVKAFVDKIGNWEPLTVSVSQMWS